MLHAVAALWLAAAPGRLPAQGPWRTSGPAYPVVEAITISPGDDAVIYAAARDPETATSGLFRSEDGGISWNLLAQAPFQAHVRRLAIDPTGPQRMLALTADGLSHDFVYRSEDGGFSWVQTAVFVADAIKAVFFDPVAPDTAYLFGTHHLARSERGGGWQDIALLNVPGSEYVDIGYSAWVSPQGGLYLTEETRYEFCLPFFNCVVDSIVVSTTQGRTFRDAGLPFCTDLESIEYAPSNPSLAYATGPGCEPLLVSRDGGVSWARLESKALSDILSMIPNGRVADIVVDPDEAETLYLTVLSSDAAAGLLLRSDDGGEHWTGVPIPAPPAGPLAIGPASRVLFLGTTQGVFRLPLDRTQALPQR